MRKKTLIARWEGGEKMGAQWRSTTTGTSSTGSTSPLANGDAQNFATATLSSSQQGGASSVSFQPRARSCGGKQTGPFYFSCSCESKRVPFFLEFHFSNGILPSSLGVHLLLWPIEKFSMKTIGYLIRYPKFYSSQLCR